MKRIAVAGPDTKDSSQAKSPRHAQSWLAALHASRSLRRRLTAILRMACRMLGLKRGRGLGMLGIGGRVAVTAGMIAGVAPDALASGIFVNDGGDSTCTHVLDGGSGGPISTINDARLCDSTTKATQTDHVLFYSVQGPHARSLSLGNELYVNGGFIGLNNNTGANPTLSMCIGNLNTSANGVNSVSIGNNAKADSDRSIALGFNSITAAATNVGNSIIINGASYTITGGTPDSVLSIGSDTLKRQITNVAAGQLNKDSTDAVNGSQLFATNSALGALGGRVGTIDTSVSNINAGKAGLVQQADATSNLTVGKDTDGAAIDLRGKTAARKLLSLTAGAVSINSTEAVNGSQLFSTGKSVADALGGGASIDATGKWTAPAFSMSMIGADGKIATTPSEKSLEAINGSQLWGVSNKIAGFLGGDASVDANGVFTGPSYKVTNINANGTTSSTSYNNVGSALGGLNDNTTNINNRINEITKEVTTLDKDSLRWDEQKGVFTALRDQPISVDGVTKMVPGTSKITNITDGEVNATSTDAVTGAQLFERDERITNIDHRVTKIETTVNTDITAAMDKTAVKYAPDASGNKTNEVALVGGDPNAPVLISNVKAGAADNDAVNVKQLKETITQETTRVNNQVNQYLDESKTYTNNQIASLRSDTDEKFGIVDQKLDQLSSDIGAVRNEARQAAAIGLAASSLRFDNTPGKISVAMGGGVWRDQGAVAFGAGYTSESGAIRANLSGVASGGEVGVGAGFTLN